MKGRQRKLPGLISLLLFLFSTPLRSADLRSLIKEIFPVPSTTGNEDGLARKLRDALPGGLSIDEDSLGGFAVRLGKGAPRLAVVVPLDGYGFFVSGIRPDGFLMVDRPVPAPHGRFDSFLLGRPVVVTTRNGPVPGIVAQPALHLLTQERRQSLVENFSLENAFVDIGVRSEKEARDKGVEILDSLTFWPALSELASGRWAGPSLGLKALCAALACVAGDLEKPQPAGEIVLVWMAQTKFLTRGREPRPSLGALRAKYRWLPRQTIILDLAAAGLDEGRPHLGKGPVLMPVADSPSRLQQDLERSAGEEKISLQRQAGTKSPLLTAFGDPDLDVLAIGLPVEFPNTPSEIVDFRDVQALYNLLARFLKTGGGR